MEHTTHHPAHTTHVQWYTLSLSYFLFLLKHTHTHTLSFSLETHTHTHTCTHTHTHMCARRGKWFWGGSDCNVAGDGGGGDFRMMMLFKAVIVEEEAAYVKKKTVHTPNQLSSVKWRGGEMLRLVQWIKSTLGPRIMYHALYVSYKIVKKSRLASKQLWQFEQRVLQTGSNEGGLQWQREGQWLRSTRYMCVAQHVIRLYRSWRTRPWIHGGTQICKAQFQGAASLCSRWSIVSFTLPGFTKFQRTLFVYTWPSLFWAKATSWQHHTLQAPFRNRVLECVSGEGWVWRPGRKKPFRVKFF